MFMILTDAYAQSLEDLENAYVKKANALKVDFDKKSVSLAKIYIKALEKKEKEIVKSGDLDKALKVRAKIKEMQAILKGESVAVVKPVANTADPIVGTWKWVSCDIEFLPNNTAHVVDDEIKPKRQLKWSKEGDTYTLYWNPSHSEYLKLTGDNIEGKTTHGVRLSAKRIK